MMNSLIYLDFDGVLHPSDVFVCADGSIGLEGHPTHKLFEGAAVLETVLEDFPDVGIVLSTTWAWHLGLRDAASRLPSLLQRRVIGSTVSATGRRWTDLSRLDQIMADQSTRQLPWIAIDDDHHHWPASFDPHIVRTDEVEGICAPGRNLELRQKLERLHKFTVTGDAVSATQSWSGGLERAQGGRAIMAAAGMP